MIKLIAIDLDDTLLNKNKEISKENKIAVNKANSQNIKIVIASGRPYFRVHPILKELNLDNDNNYVISYNGAYISNGNNTKIIKRNVLNNQDINNIVDEITKHNLTFMVYVNDDIYTTYIPTFIKDKLVFKDIDFKPLTIEEIRKLEFANKIIIADEETKIRKHVDTIKHNINGKYNVLKSATDFLEFLTIDSNKGIALKQLTSYLHLTKEEVMAIGDEENDLSMFDVASIKVAMENATLVLKQKSTFITKDQEHSGVAYAINNVLQNCKK